MPDVRMPDGTIVRNVPDGITQSELQRRLAKAVPSMGPTSMTGREIEREAMSQVAEGANANPTGGFLERMNAKFAPGELAPLLGVGAGLMAPGPGWAALLASSALTAGGTAAGEAAKQDIRGDIDPAAALKSGAAAGAGNLAGGAVLKTLGATAKAIFASPLDDAQRASASFAKQQGVPFPLSSAAPRTGAARTQQGARALLVGELKTQADANKVTQYLNQRVSSIVDNASPVDEAAMKGQQFLRKVFEPGETIYTETFKNLRSTLGDDTAIPLANTRQVIAGASEALKKRGEMKAVFNRLRNITKGDATEMTVSQLDELYSGILKDIGRNTNASREANAVLAAIGRDIDGVAKDFGVSFSDDVAAAKAVRDQFRDLRNIPQLERLSKEFGDRGGTLGSRQWMPELFSNPNGKALAELRARNPELYHELADSWLASHINRFSKPAKDGFGRALDGQAFRSWFEQNQGNLKVILGGPQTQALDNFSLYAKHMAGAVERSVNPNKFSSDPIALMTRGGAEATGIVTNPLILIPGEAASYVLAKGLSDPSSQLFKVFTEGFSPATRSFVVKSGQLGGQAAARRSEK